MDTEDRIEIMNKTQLGPVTTFTGYFNSSDNNS